jgi:hypothetical protein
MYRAGVLVVFATGLLMAFRLNPRIEAMLNALRGRHHRPLSRLTAAIAFGAFLLAPLACSGTTGEAPSAPPVSVQGDLIARLPADATTIGFVDVAALRDSGMYDYAEEQGADLADVDDLQEFIEKTGFDPRTDLHQIVWMTRGGFGGEEKGTGALLALATLDSERITEALADRPSFEYGGRTVYQLREDGEDGEIDASGMEISFDTSGALALLSGDSFVAGSEEAVRAVIDVQGGAPSARTNTRMMELLEDVDTDAELWAIAAQDGMLAGLRSEGESTMPQIPIDRINSMIASLRVTDGLAFTFRGRTGAEEDAKLLGDSLNGMLAFGKMMLQSNEPEIFKIIDEGVTAGSSGYDVTVRARLTVEQLETLRQFARKTMSDDESEDEQVG